MPSHNVDEAQWLPSVQSLFGELQSSAHDAPSGKSVSVYVRVNGRELEVSDDDFGDDEPGIYATVSVSDEDTDGDLRRKARELLADLQHAASRGKKEGVDEMAVGASDKHVILAFLDGKQATSKKLDSDGTRLDGLWMGGKGIADWGPDHKIHMPDLGSKAADTVQRTIRDLAPANDIADESADPQENTMTLRVNELVLDEVQAAFEKAGLASPEVREENGAFLIDVSDDDYAKLRGHLPEGMKCTKLPKPFNKGRDGAIKDVHAPDEDDDVKVCVPESEQGVLVWYAAKKPLSAAAWPKFFDSVADAGGEVLESDPEKGHFIVAFEDEAAWRAFDGVLSEGFAPGQRFDFDAETDEGLSTRRHKPGRRPSLRNRAPRAPAPRVRGDDRRHYESEQVTLACPLDRLDELLGAIEGVPQDAPTETIGEEFHVTVSGAQAKALTARLPWLRSVSAES